MLMRKSKSIHSARVMAFIKCRMSNAERNVAGRVCRSMERKRNHFDSNSPDRFRFRIFRRERIQPGVGAVEAAFYVSKSNFFSQSLAARGACDPANFLPRR